MRWYEVKATNELGTTEYHVVCKTQVAIGMIVTERIVSTYGDEEPAKETVALLNATVDPSECRW